MKVAAQYPTSVWDGSSATRSASESIFNTQSADASDWDQMTAELQAAQTELDRYKAEDEIVVPNAVGGALVEGSAVYLKADGSGVAKADADAAAPLADCIGIVRVGRVATGGNVTVKMQGDLTLTTAQWDVITGDTGGLVVDKVYFLSKTAGGLTTTRPATTADHVIQVGIARSATVLNIQIVHRADVP